MQKKKKKILKPYPPLDYQYPGGCGFKNTKNIFLGSNLILFEFNDFSFCCQCFYASDDPAKVKNIRQTQPFNKKVKSINFHYSATRQ